MNMLESFGFQGYRSFASDSPALLAPLSKVNLIVGPNNSGKSNILRALMHYCGGGQPPLGRLDLPQGEIDAEMVVFRSIEIDDLWNQLSQSWQRLEYHRDQVLALLRAMPAPGGFEPDDTSSVWVGLTPDLRTSGRWAVGVATALGDVRIATALSDITTNTQSSDALGNLVRFLATFGQFVARPPRAEFVEGTRAIRLGTESDEDLNGTNLFGRLLKLQIPAIAELEERHKFDAVQDFVRDVLDDPHVQISVPHDANTLHVTQRDITLPVENLGMGVHEVVILAVAATVVTDSVLCIEEPEVHLHPLLQRKLLAYLERETRNQYFIATHSAHLLDSANASVFHVSRPGTSSSVRLIERAGQRSQICVDLGYRPSDLVQANAVLWVEGPSDRVYLNSWIERMAPGRFVEGIHYSIMFYGGSLLASLTTQDEYVDDFIALRRLNRFMLVMIDSDRKAHSTLAPGKRRIRDELLDGDQEALVWITDGYTVENYVPQPVVDDAVRACHTSVADRSFVAFDKWSNPLASSRIGIQQPDKVAVARYAVDHPERDSWPLDLKKRVQDVVDLISRANVGR